MVQSQILLRSEDGTLFIKEEHGMYTIRDTSKPFEAQDFTYYIYIADAKNAFLEKKENKQHAK
jgi:hypothetical protein